MNVEEDVVVNRFVAIDIETGGLDPTKHPIIEVGLVIERPRYGGALHDTVLLEEVDFTLEFDESKADPKALAINGWGRRPFPAVEREDFAVGLLRGLLGGAYIVGKNPSFDMGFITTLFRRYDLEPCWHHRLVDVGSLAWGYHCAQARAAHEPYWDMPPNSEKVAHDFLDLPQGDFHRALTDARWAYTAFRKVVLPLG